MRKLVILIAGLALAVAACGGGDNGGGGDPAGPVVPGDSVAGADIYKGTCSACHGKDLEGIDGLGSVLEPSDFIANMSEDDLAAFVLVGRSSDDPENTTGIDMPAKGGNPSLSDQDVQDIAAFMKSEN